MAKYFNLIPPLGAILFSIAGLTAAQFTYRDTVQGSPSKPSTGKNVISSKPVELPGYSSCEELCSHYQCFIPCNSIKDPQVYKQLSEIYLIAAGQRAKLLKIENALEETASLPDSISYELPTAGLQNPNISTPPNTDASQQTIYELLKEFDRELDKIEAETAPGSHRREAVLDKIPPIMDRVWAKIEPAPIAILQTPENLQSIAKIYFELAEATAKKISEDYVKPANSADSQFIKLCLIARNSAQSFSQLKRRCADYCSNEIQDLNLSPIHEKALIACLPVFRPNPNLSSNTP